MSEASVQMVRPTDKVGRILYAISQVLALFGGLVVAAMAIMTTTSIFGRAFLSSPVPGDIELIELGTSTAVFAFLPYCQMVRGNVIVDFFLSWASRKVKIFFDVIGGILFLGVALMLTWRLIFGGIDLYNAAETTGVLAFPRWISFPYAFVCLSTLVFVIIYTLFHNDPESGEQAMLHE
ncbi:MAG: TRAP transporter small permease [Rhodospirillales bacterium]|nr:TRAP transporter small permease [Rhodospirillales bacterium]